MSKEKEYLNLMTKPQPGGYYGVDCLCGNSSFVIDKIVAKQMKLRLNGLEVNDDPIEQTCPKCKGTFLLHKPMIEHSNENPYN